MTDESLPEAAYETVEPDELDAILSRDTHEQDDSPEADEAPAVSVKEEEKPAPEPAKAETQQNPNEAAGRAAMAERRKAQERIDRLEAELNQFRQQATQAKQPPPPSFDDDPASALKYQTEQLAKENQETRQRLEQLQRAESVRVYEAQARQVVSQMEAAVVAQNPDYYDALEHVRNVERTRMAYFPDEHVDSMVSSFGFNPQAFPDKQSKINEIVKRQEWSAALQLIQNNMNPADYVYSLAKSFGYQQNKVAPEAKRAPNKEASDAIERAKAGQKLSKGGASAPTVDAEEEDSGNDIFSVLSDLRKRK